MKLTLRGQLLIIALVGIATVLLGVTLSYASGLAPLPEAPQWHPAVVSP